MKKQTKCWWIFNCSTEQQSGNNKPSCKKFDLKFYGTIQEAFDFFFKRENFPQPWLINFDAYFTGKYLCDQRTNNFTCENGRIFFSFNNLELGISVDIHCLKHKGGYDLKKKSEFLIKFTDHIQGLRKIKLGGAP